MVRSAYLRITLASRPPWCSNVLQHPPHPTQRYRRHKAGVLVMAWLQRAHLALSAAACLALSLPAPARRLARAGAGPMSGIASDLFAPIKLWMHSFIPKPNPPFQRTAPVDAGRPVILNFPFLPGNKQVRPISVDERT